MKHRPSNANQVSAELISYLVTSRGLSQNQIAEVLEVDKSFISRVRAGERDLSSRQMRRLADHLDVPLGAMLIDSTPPPKRPLTGDRKQIVDLCQQLMAKADQGVAAARAERALRREALANRAASRQPPSSAA